MKWIARERVKVDRVACPWLLRRLVAPQAAFLFVPAEQVMSLAEQTGAIPYDVPGVALGHHGKACSAEWVVYDALYAYCQQMVAQGRPNGMFKE